jgi:hypothetical protein
MKEIFPSETENDEALTVEFQEPGKFRVLAANLPDVLHFLMNADGPCSVTNCWQDWDNPDEWWIQIDLRE